MLSWRGLLPWGYHSPLVPKTLSPKDTFVSSDYSPVTHIIEEQVEVPPLRYIFFSWAAPSTAQTEAFRFEIYFGVPPAIRYSTPRGKRTPICEPLSALDHPTPYPVLAWMVGRWDVCGSAGPGWTLVENTPDPRLTSFPFLYQQPLAVSLLSLHESSARSPTLAAVSDSPETNRTPGSVHQPRKS